MGKTGIVLRDPAGVIGNVSPDGPPWATAPEWTNVRRHIASGRPDPLAATIAGGASTADYPSRHIAYSPRHRIGRNRQTSLPSPTAPVPGGDVVGGNATAALNYGVSGLGRHVSTGGGGRCAGSTPGHGFRAGSRARTPSVNRAAAGRHAWPASSSIRPSVRGPCRDPVGASSLLLCPAWMPRAVTGKKPPVAARGQRAVSFRRSPKICRCGGAILAGSV